MQQIVIDKPYEFVPPCHSDIWPSLIQYYLARYLRKTFGVHTHECRHADRLRESLDQGHGILLAPNHCRLSDPLVLGFLARQLHIHLYAMASWHVFEQDKLTRFMLRRVGAFSVYREGMDRQALNLAIDILDTGRRPLVVFPEGSISRHNDQLGDLMDGVAFIARAAARKRAKREARGQVVIHPIAIRYFFRGDLQEVAEDVLDDLEVHFAWRPKKGMSVFERIRKVGEACLALKEIEYFGFAKTGDLYERVEALIDYVLAPLEKEWNIRDVSATTVGRVKKLRAAILPDMVNGELDEVERERCWQQLAACYYAQQMSHYPRDYIVRQHPVKERVLETLERLEEDLTDHLRVHEPLHVVLDVGPAIEVPDARPPRGQADPVMQQLESSLAGLIEQLGREAERVALH